MADLRILQAIELKNCDVYSYQGDGEIDPLSKYFFLCFSYTLYNKEFIEAKKSFPDNLE